MCKSTSFESSPSDSSDRIHTVNETFTVGIALVAQGHERGSFASPYKVTVPLLLLPLLKLLSLEGNDAPSCY